MPSLQVTCINWQRAAIGQTVDLQPIRVQKFRLSKPVCRLLAGRETD
jgi:hypothetical protein